MRPRRADKGERLPDDANVVYDLDPGQTVGCYFCIEDRIHTSYGRGDAFLAGPGHTPYDARANYVCRAHLDDDAVIVDPAPWATV